MYILTALASVSSVPNFTVMLYNTTFLTISQAFLKSTNNQCTAPFYSHFYQVFDEYKICYQYLIYDIEIHFDGPNNFIYIWS